MAEKRVTGRFTVQFNMEDPQQRQAAEFLDRQGRRKAQVITNAVLHYLNCDKAASAPAPGNGDLLESRLLDIIKKALGQDRDSEAAPVPSVKKSEEASPAPAVDYSAIERTMLAFDQQ